MYYRLAGARIADNTTSTHHWSGPTNRLAAAGAAVKPDNRVPRPGETQSESDPLVNFYENTPPEAPVWTPHCGQPRRHPSLVCAHELYESTKQSLHRSIDLGKGGTPVDSCTTDTRMMRPGRIIWGRSPPCGQHHPHPLFARTHETSPCSRSAAGLSQNLTTPFRDLGKQRAKTGRSSTSTRPTQPAGPLRTPHCGQRRVHQQWVDTQSV